MSIIIDQNTRVLVQGATGGMARFQIEEMKRAGTNLVAGVSPGKGGDNVAGVPVFDTVHQALNHEPIDLSVIFVGASRAKDAIYEAIDQEIETIVCVAEYMPVHDMIAIDKAVQGSRSRLLGPNCSGIMSPGKAKVGYYTNDITMPGKVGVMSKSGTLSYAVLLEMKRAGIGVSTVVGVGGDEIKGTRFRDCIELFYNDPDTEALVILGEVGGRDEEDAADFVKRSGIRKPVVALVSGRSIPKGKSIGHAGAMVVGKKGGYEGKINALQNAGVAIATNIAEVPTRLQQQLRIRGKESCLV